MHQRKPAQAVGHIDEPARASENSDPVAVVSDFLHALAAQDVECALALVTPDVEWRNTGLPALRGARASAAMRYLDRSAIGFAVEIHSAAATGETVLTDRTDYLSLGPVETGFRVFGAFTLRHGRIAKWDDHFSLRNIATGFHLRRGSHG